MLVTLKARLEQGAVAGRLLWLLLAGLSTSSGANAGEPLAVSAKDFLDSLGACSAVSKRGEDLAATIRVVRFLGLRWLRVVHRESAVADLIELHQETGVQFSYGLGSGDTNIARLIEGAGRLAAAGALIAIESLNEPNNWGITYQGQAGGKKASWLPVAQLQRDLYQAVKSNAALRAYPVWSISENGAETDNVGLQFLTIPNGAGALMPDGTQYADFANVHNYITHPGWPGLHDNQTWMAADPSSACRMDGLYGNYGLTWGRHYPGYAESALATLPRVTTETGATLADAVTEEIQARFYLSIYLDQFKRGSKHTAIYLLRDRTDESGNQTFGFYKPDYSPRLAATYLHHLTAILADPRSTTTPGQLGYAIDSQPATVHDLLLRKSDGKFALLVWDERLSGSDDVTVNLGAVYPSVTIYDPTVGTAPIQCLTNVGSVGLVLSNHPVIIEIPARP